MKVGLQKERCSRRELDNEDTKLTASADGPTSHGLTEAVLEAPGDDGAGSVGAASVGADSPEVT